jgi:hypothetical protein
MMTVTAPTAFEFDHDYSNLAQIMPLYPAYTERRQELDAKGHYPYNASFRGYLGIHSGKDEDTAIYLCQTLTHIHEDALKVNAFIDAGGRFLADDERPAGRFDVAMFGWYMSGDGFRVYEDVRLVWRQGTTTGRPYMVLPKGKRTHGYSIEGVVLVKEAM